VSRLVLSITLAAALGGLAYLAVPAPSPAQEKGQKDKAKAAKGGAVEVFKDRAGEYRWRVTDAEGKVIGMTTKGYDTKQECLKALEAVKETLAKTKVTEVTGDKDGKKDK
jgi:uncharacterized protein YegP (UPF0339 family)